MRIEILTPDTNIFTGEVSLVQLPGLDGLFEILDNHAPMIAALTQGKAKVVCNGETKLFDITGGVVEVLKNKIIVLAL